MTDMPQSRYTLRAIAGELRLPESTVRYYRDLFEPWLPAEGRGRRRRYTNESVELFRLIAEGYAQNRNRREIEAALTDAANGRAPVTVLHHTAPFPDRADPVLATVLEGEREHREVMWQMAQEIVRLGEVLERQHAVLHELVRRLDVDPRRTLPPTGPDSGAVRGDDRTLDEKLSALRRELDVERDLVERLRKSKLDLERRTAEAEAALETGRSGLLRRVLRRDGGS